MAKKGVKLAKTVKSVILEEKNRCCYLDGIYETSNISFALAVPTDKNKIMLTTPVNSCREELIHDVWNEIVKKGKMQELKKTHIVMFASSAGIEPDEKGNCGPFKVPNEGEGRYSLSYDEWLRQVAKAGLKIVNHFEKRNKWLQSKAYKVILPRARSTKHAYYFIGSRWWIYSPHSLSLYLLLIRLGRFEKIRKLCKNMSKGAFLKTLKSIDVKSYGKDLLHDAPVWYPMTKNISKIYDHHRGKATGCWNIVGDCTEGIYDFVNGDTNDNAAYTKFCKILVKARRRKRV